MIASTLKLRLCAGLACMLSVLAPMAHGLNTLAPAILVFPSPPPADAQLLAYVFLSANYGSVGMQQTPATVSGTTVTAVFDDSCGRPCNPTDIRYFASRVNVPPLPAGDYTLRVIHSSGVDAQQFSLKVGGTVGNDPPAQLAIPAPPQAGVPFSVDAYTLIQRFFYFSSFDPVSVNGNTITAPIHLFTECDFNECPPNLGYGPYPIDIPGLAAGNYTLKIVDAQAPGTVFAQFPLGVGAVTSVPHLRLEFALALIALLALMACATLRIKAYPASRNGLAHG